MWANLAALTGGQIFVSSGLDLGEVLSKAFASMRTVRLHQPKLAGSTSPTTAAALTGGMVVTARWGAAQLAPVTDIGMSRAVAAYAAWLALPIMEEAEAAALAESEGVVSHLTSLVLVDEAGETQDGIPMQRKVPLMTPAADPRLFACAPPVESESSRAPTGFRGLVRRVVADQSHAPAFSITPDPPAPATRHSGTVGDEARRPGQDSDANGPDFEIPTFLRRRTSGQAASSAGHHIGLPTRPPVTTAQAGAAPVELRAVRGRVDWTGDLEALSRGELLGNIPADVLVQLQAAAKVDAVQDLAATLGVTPEAVVVALLARVEAANSRGAARLARKVFAAADPAKVEMAARAAGFC